MKKLSCPLFLLFLSLPGWALEIPTGIDTENEFAEVIQILGLSTSGKHLTNPFALGGYSGFEFGLSLEVVNTSDLAQIGDQTDDQSELSYAKLTLGKGLYNNVDVFFHFIPFSNNNNISHYGGSLKWSFYQAQFLPLTAALTINGDTFNANDEFVSETLGANLMTGINVDNFALYFGGGHVESWAKLKRLDTGPPFTIIDQKETQVHSFVGVSFHYSSLFIAGQIDRYEQPTYSAKLGMRY